MILEKRLDPKMGKIHSDIIGNAPRPNRAWHESKIMVESSRVPEGIVFLTPVLAMVVVSTLLYPLPLLRKLATHT